MSVDPMTFCLLLPWFCAAALLVYSHFLPPLPDDDDTPEPPKPD